MFRILRLAFALAWLGVLPAAAGEPVAIVETVSAPGAGVRVMDYLEAGKQIDLGPSGEITLGYMTSCWRETVRGGVLIVGAEQSAVANGRVERAKVDCDPSLMSPGATDKEPGVLKVRSARAGRIKKIGRLQPVFHLAAPGGTVKIKAADGSRAWDLTASGRYLDLQANGVSLRPGTRYDIRHGNRKTRIRTNPDAKSGGGILERLVQL